jgi:hypothetical protein
MPSNAKTIATDLIAQMADAEWAIPYTIAYRRMYIDALEKLPQAGSPNSKMKITLAPVQYENERIGWGAARVTCSLGIICEIKIADPDNDDEIDPYEAFVESLSTFLIGARQFAGWNSAAPKAIFGDEYISELYENRRFFVPILIDFFKDCGVA